MKQRFLTLMLALLVLHGVLPAQDFVNLTPKPKSMTVQSGKLVLPRQFTVGYTGLDDEMVNEVERFVAAFNLATGYEATASQGDGAALIQVGASSAAAKDGAYSLTVDAEKATLKAKDALGLFYAFQTLKKMLPANVMAGVKDASVTEYALPRVVITDEPRFAYRGFMLDVSRHFFTVKEVKRVLDLMSYYKLNKFHWHLTDDQGWRIEIKKYPKLTTIGATAPNSRFTDMYSCTQYWINKPYGPYYYTQEEMKDVVAYAKERHIEVIPEIDMPGHFVAALAAYPEYSCHPAYAPTVWTTGGISSDVLNVANPDAVQFVKDILTELIGIFPSETIHIGGDECPTTQWESNADCQALYKKLGLSSYRGLQSNYIKEINAFAQEHGRKLAVWNEAITADGADTKLIQDAGATVYCWTGPEAAAKKAKQLGLKNIYTPWGPYYINRKQGNSELDPPGAGYGTDDVKATYNQSIPSETDYGVQGTFWCEHVSDREYMEWLALPRLIAVAEAGWTPQAQRSFSDFQKRMTADTLLLDYNDYKYCRYHMLVENDGYPVTQKTMPKASTDSKKYYYRLISGGTDATRKDRCIELLSESSPLLTEYAGKSAQAGRLWTNVQATKTDGNYDYQWWGIEKDPSGSGKYAIVCKAMPDGSVKPVPTASNTSGRWEYDNSTKHYNFTLGEKAYGAIGSNYYYTISSDQVSGQYWNSSMSGQGLAVNLYSNPNDGNGGQWQFSPMEDYGWDGGGSSDPIVFDGLTAGKTYTFTNTVDGFEATALTDDNTSGTELTHSTDAFAANAWMVTEAGEPQADGTQTLKLKNATTGRFISGTSARVSGKGFPVTLGARGVEATWKYDTTAKDFRLLVNGHSLFPLPAGTVNSGATIDDASYDAPRLQGAGWQAGEVRVVTFVCTDDKGADLGTWKRSVPVGTAEITADLCPVFKNTEVESLTETAENTYAVLYKRAAYTVTLRCLDPHGAIVAEEGTDVAVGGTYTLTAPDVKCYTFSESGTPIGTVLTPTGDQTIELTYTTDAYTGVKTLGNLVTEGLRDGNSYVFYDASPADGGARKGYRKISDGNLINRATSAEGLEPTGVWTLEASGANFKVKNEYKQLYVPALSRSQAATASSTGGVFSFKLNSDGTSWCIKGTNGQMWDGVSNGNLVGWDGGSGHPIELYTYWAQPYYTLTIRCEDEAGKELKTVSRLLPAGEAQPLVFPTIEGYSVKSATGHENYEGTVEGFVTVNVVYTDNATGIGGVEAATAGDLRKGIYDLQGRRLQRVSGPGLYIVNGRKVLVK